MQKVNIDCENLTKVQINELIAGLINIDLHLHDYKYEDFAGLILPSSLHLFSCFHNKITSFIGLVLPPNLVKFNCSHNRIRSFDGLILPSSGKRKIFQCSYNKITSFIGLIIPDSFSFFDCSGNWITNFSDLNLPSSITYFNCSYNEITSFSGLKFLPDKVRGLILLEFDCSRNKITSLVGLELPHSLRKFNCSNNKITSFFSNFTKIPSSLRELNCLFNNITIIQDFEFPESLTKLEIDENVKFVNPKFNSALKLPLRNRVILNYNKLNRDNLLFLYLNFNFPYQQYESLMNEV
jgi:Leucine-rich repeat (LRR) protein